MREAIAALPNGTYQYETDTDGFDAPIRLVLTITVAGDHLVADYAGTSPQVKQAINVVYNYTEAYTTFGLKVALAPDVPNNEGSFRAVTVRAPEGSVLNCLHPAPGTHFIAQALGHHNPPGGIDGSSDGRVLPRPALKQPRRRGTSTRHADGTPR
jgi:N-methylhydantoinase B